jgi:hypothetical protein
LELLLKKAKAINMTVKIEADVRKMMSEKIAEETGESTAKEEQK